MESKIVDKAILLIADADKNGVTAYSIAKETRITENTIRNYIKGRTKPTKANAQIIIDYLEPLVLTNNSANIDRAPIGNRIREFREYKGLSQTEFAESIGMKQGSYSDIERGRSKGISNTSLENIVNTYNDIDSSWLLTGANQMLKDTQQNKTQGMAPYTLERLIKDYNNSCDMSKISVSLLNTEIKRLSDKEIGEAAQVLGIDYTDLKNGIEILLSNNNQGKLVPIINTTASAGENMVELSGTREGWVNVGDLLKDSEGALYIYGNSMIPGYPPGALIGMRKRLDSFIEPGNVYVVQTQSSRYVKRLYYNDERTAFFCLSDNHIKHTDGALEGKSYYPPFEIPLEEVVSIWDVTGVIKRNRPIVL